MTMRRWERIKVLYCQHAAAEAALEVQVVYPPEWFPDQPPRVLAHRCSRAAECNLVGKPSCIWAGTNPVFDPFIELP